MRIGDKKTIVISSAAVFSVIVSMAVLVSRSSSSFSARAVQDSNSLIISPSNPVTNGYVKTTKGNPIYIKDDGVAWGGSNLTFENGGYIQTLTIIHGIQSVSVELSSGSLDLYHGYVEPSNLETPMYGSDYTFVSSYTYVFSSDMPNRVRLRASEEAVISKITINYDCSSVNADPYVETLDDGLENSYIDAGNIKSYATTSYSLATSSSNSTRSLKTEFKNTNNNYVILSTQMNVIRGIADSHPDFTNAVLTLKAKFSSDISNYDIAAQAVGSGWKHSNFITMEQTDLSQDGWHSYSLDFTDISFEDNDDIIRIYLKPLGIDASNKATGYVIFDEIDYHQHTKNQEINHESIYDGLENMERDVGQENVYVSFDNKVTYGRTSQTSLVARPKESMGSKAHYFVVLSPEGQVSSGLSPIISKDFSQSVLMFEYKPINIKNPNTIYLNCYESWSSGSSKTVTTTQLSGGWYLFSYDLRNNNFTSPDLIRIYIGFDVDASNINIAKVYFDNIRLNDTVREDYTQGLENLAQDDGMSAGCNRSIDYTMTASDSSLNSLKCVLNGSDAQGAWANKYGPTFVLDNNQLSQMTCNSGILECKFLFSGAFLTKRLWLNLIDASWNGGRFKDIVPVSLGNGWYQVSIDLSTLPSWGGDQSVSAGFNFSGHPIRVGFGFQDIDSSNNTNKTVWVDDMFYYPTSSSSDFGVWQAYDTENILQTDDTLPNRGISSANPLAFSDARNGTDSSQLMIKANSGISSYSFRAGSLRGSNGDVLPSTCFETLVAKYVYIGDTVETGKTGHAGPGYYPDALVPIDRIIKANENSVASGNQQSIWVNCKIPTNQRAGTYTGKGILNVNGVDYTIPMKVVVYDVTLSGVSHNKNSYLLWYDRMEIAEPNYSKSMRTAYYNFCLTKGISPDGNYDWNKWTIGEMDEYDSFADNFANYIMPNDKISTYRIPADKNQESILRYLTALVNRNKIEWDEGNHVNFFDKAIFILTDEPSNPTWSNPEPQAWKDCKSVQQWIKSAQSALAPSLTDYPELLAGLNSVRNVTTIGADFDKITGQGLFYKDLLTTDYLGVPCPQFQLVDPSSQRETFFSRFERTWFYGCVHPQLPYPSYHTDTPLIGQRLITWMQYDYGFDGTLYFCVDMFSTSDQGQASYRDVWNDPMVGNTAGDGQLLYPGNRYNIYGPITTMRLETIRNAMEDYEYFYLMNERIAKYNANTGANISSCRDLLSSYYSQMYSGTQLLTRGHTFDTGFKSENFESVRTYLLERLEYCF